MNILQVTGFKNSGKTTTVNRMIGYLKDEGYKVAVFKNHHSDDVVFSEDTDTGKFIGTGADFTILNSPSTSMIVTNDTPYLKDQLKKASEEADFILLEGYKDEVYPKIYLEYSFTKGHTPVWELELKNVLKTFDLRYDKDNIMEWFKEWSAG